jgi:hypothetical protein
MPDTKPTASDPSQQREMALARWDNEGAQFRAARKTL